MDVILSHFSASELRVKCLSAVQDELHHTQTQLPPALDALKRSLSVVRASRKMIAAPFVLVDESPHVATALAQIVASCNEIGTLICDLSRELSSSGASEASPSDTDDEEQHQEPKSDKAEPKQTPATEKVTVERKKAAKDTTGMLKRQVKAAKTKPVAKTTSTVIDLSLSDEEEEKVVKHEVDKDAPSAGRISEKTETLEILKKRVDGVETEEISQRTTPEKQEVPAQGGVGSSIPVAVMEPPPALMEDESEVAGGVYEQRSSRKRKKKAPKAEVLPAQKRRVRDVIVRLRQRAEMAPSGAVGVAVCSSLNAAIALEEHQEATTKGLLKKTFASATAEAGRVLMEVYKSHPVQTERHLEDMRLLMSVAATNFDCELSRDEVRMAWQMLKEVQKIHDNYPAKTKYLHRNCLRLRKYILKKYEVPADVVGDLKTQLLKMLVELRGWKPYQGLPIEPFDQKMSIINELLGNRYELWDPRTEPILGQLVGIMERICTFGEGDAWNDRYVSICRACSQMSRSTFVWSCDLADDITDRLERSDILEPGFEDAHRVEENLRHVTSYDDQVRHLTDADSKKAAFDELIDRVRWIFNAVAMTRNQSLLPLNRLKRLNLCVTTLVDLCDNGLTLNLEGCLHLEKLLLVMRQVMYVRIDYASCSKRAVDALIGLFPPDKRPRLGYPAGCTHAD